MYKNITYFNKHKSVKKYEKRLLESSIFNEIVKTKEQKNLILYANPDVLIIIKKHVVNFFVFNHQNYYIINQIEELYNLTNKG